MLDEILSSVALGATARWTHLGDASKPVCDCSKGKLIDRLRKNRPAGNLAWISRSVRNKFVN
jgi:hypothetical protein